MAAPLDSHEWVSFEDPDEARTWVFDVTFLTSSWTCIFGRGCQGVLTAAAPEMVQGCCSYGAHFVDEDDEAHIVAIAANLTKDEWQFRKQGLKRGISKTNKEGERVTRLVDDACIFLNRPDFEGGAGCALHRAAMNRGARPMDWKPDVCWQLPLRREDEEHDDGSVTSRVIQWDRKHWGEGGNEFHWWCTESPDAFVGGVPVYKELEHELVALTSRQAYDMLVEYLESRTRDGWVPLPHPAVRSKPAHAEKNGKGKSGKKAKTKA